MEGPPLGRGGEDITWPDQVAPRGRKASSTRKIKPQTSNLLGSVFLAGCCVCVQGDSQAPGLTVVFAPLSSFLLQDSGKVYSLA